jgi:hypothetical protein
MKLIKIFSILFGIVGIYAISPLPSFATQSGKIMDYHYLTHYSISETVNFAATVKNTGTVFDDYYIQPVLTNYDTGAESYSTPVTGTINAGETGILRASWVAVSGLYTVTIILYSSGDLEVNRVYGREPVHVGRAVDSVAAFPRVLDLGALQYGRFMHPVPVEINWSFYLRSSQVRKDHPWYMRIYTDNHQRYQGVERAIYFGRTATQEGGSASAMGSPAGLVSSDGKYAIPLKVWCLNFGPDVEEGWDANLLGPPPVKEDYYWRGPLLDTGRRDSTRVAWEWIPDYIDMSADPATWRKLIGQDSYDTHYVSDSNPTGDFTLPSPFQVYIAYETSPTSVMGKYSTDLIVEIYSP